MSHHVVTALLVAVVLAQLALPEWLRRHGYTR